MTTAKVRRMGGSLDLGLSERLFWTVVEQKC